MNDLKKIIITGGGTGIGRALALYCAERGHHALIIGRRESKLAKVKAFFPDHIDFIAADITHPEFISTLTEKLQGSNVQYLIHNAGLLAPTGNILEADTEALRYSIAVNLEAPIAINKALLPYFQKGARCLHISSGAATRAIEGWGAYCITKAAFRMLFEVLKLDFKKYGVHVGSLRPGIVDTPMQEYIRGLSPDQFPDVAYFQELKKKSQLRSSEDAARAIYWLLTKADAATFSEKEWDIECISFED